MKLQNLFNRFKKSSVSLSVGQKQRIVTRAQKNTKNLPSEWKLKMFHSQVTRLTSRRKARMAMTHLRILGIEKRRKIIKLVDVFVDNTNNLHKNYKTQTELKNAYKNEQNIFYNRVEEILGKKSSSFLESFEKIKG